MRDSDFLTGGGGARHVDCPNDAARRADADAGVQLLRHVLPRQLHRLDVLGVFEEGKATRLVERHPDHVARLKGLLSLRHNGVVGVLIVNIAVVAVVSEGVGLPPWK